VTVDEADLITDISEPNLVCVQWKWWFVLLRRWRCRGHLKLNDTFNSRQCRGCLTLIAEQDSSTGRVRKGQAIAIRSVGITDLL
jgi:hypothetical protein